MLQERRVEKNYKAIVVGKIIGSFEINEPIGRDANNRTKMSVRSDGKEAYSFVRLEESYQNYSLLDISIKTGRTHQIRAHMAHLGHALIGDATYGRRKKISNKALNEDGFNLVNEFQRQALHASFLGFIHPLTGKQMKFSLNMPSDMQNLALGLKK